MPLSVPHFPSLGLGLLKPALQAIGERCEIRYFSLDYVDHVGADDHACLIDPTYYMAHVGEWVFADAAHGRPATPGLAFLVECFAREFPGFHTASRIATFLRARSGASEFIERCFASVAWCDYDIVGFTSSFQQTMASLALARRIRQDHPQIRILFGGVNCQDRMGRALLENYAFVDAVCLGEGDRCFPEWVRRLRTGAALHDVPGMAVRAGAPCVTSNDAITVLDDLPYPDYDEFFEQHARAPQAALHTPAVVFETARGCWWGERHHCTFCGLNGTTMAFRAKSSARAYAELDYLVHRHACRDVANADKILDEGYFDGFIPQLADAKLGLLIYYEAKVGMSPERIALLARAGIRKVQFGIETFDTDLLRLMAKGTTMLQNIEVLKLAAENGIYVEWLALSGFPGERAEQYDRLASLLPKLFHLQPPAAFIRARADRFSPYERDPGRYGVHLEPLPAYRHIFPFEDHVVRSFANHFIVRSPELEQHDTYVAAAAEQYAAWKVCGPASELWYEDCGVDVAVHDTRGRQSERVSILRGPTAALLRHCWRIRRWSDVVAVMEHGEVALTDAVAELEERSFMVREGSRCLTLALRQPGYRGAPSWADIRGAA